MLRLRWALLNNPSCLMHRLHIVIVHPLVALGVCVCILLVLLTRYCAVESRTIIFFLVDLYFFFFVCCCNALQCVVVSCITRPNTEGCLGTFSNTLFVPEVTITRWEICWSLFRFFRSRLSGSTNRHDPECFTLRVSSKWVWVHDILMIRRACDIMMLFFFNCHKTSYIYIYTYTRNILLCLFVFPTSGYSRKHSPPALHTTSDAKHAKPLICRCKQTPPNPTS